MASEPPPSKNRSGFSRQAALAMELPFLIAGGAIAGGFLGYLLDNYFHTKPYLMLLIGAVGFAVGLRDLLRRLDKQDGPGPPQQ
jgi:F0F1-type ATP synthase assembly protein I